MTLFCIVVSSKKHKVLHPTTKSNKYTRSNFRNEITKGFYHDLKNSCYNSLINKTCLKSLLIPCISSQSLTTAVEDIKHCTNSASSRRSETEITEKASKMNTFKDLLHTLPLTSFSAFITNIAHTRFLC